MVCVHHFRLVRAGEMPYQLAGVVGDVDNDRTGSRRVQIEIDHGAVRRILACRFLRRQRGVSVVVAADAVSYLGGEEKGIGLRDLRDQVPERRDIVENPEGPAVCGHDEVVVMDNQIANGSGRKVEAQRLPVIAVVERDIHRVLGAGEKKAFAFRIFANRVYRCIVGKSVDNFLPALAAVMRAVDIRAEIIQAEPVYRSIGGGRIEVRRIHLSQFAPWRQVRRRNVLPILTAVVRNLHLIIVRPRPYHVYVFG